MYEKEKKKLDEKIVIVEEGIFKVLEGDYKNTHLLLSYLNKKEKILQSTRKSLILTNRDNLINYGEEEI